MVVVPTNGPRPVGAVVGDIMHSATALARAEARLAVAEFETKVTAKATGAARAGGVIAAGGVFAVLALAGLLTAATAALAIYMATWLAALIVTAVAGILAYVMVMAGVSKLRNSLKPSTTATPAKERT